MDRGSVSDFHKRLRVCITIPKQRLLSTNVALAVSPTGQTRWKMKLDGRSSLTYVDKHFVNQSESGLLTLFQATDSGYIEAGRLDETNSEIVPSYPAWNAPVIAKRIMYLRGKHELIAYDLAKSQ